MISHVIPKFSFSKRRVRPWLISKSYKSIILSFNLENKLSSFAQMGEESMYLVLSHTSCTRKEWNNTRNSTSHTTPQQCGWAIKINRTLVRWEDKAIKCMLFGYNETTKGYRIYNPMTKHNWTSKDVQFDETCFQFTPSVITVSNQRLNSDKVARGLSSTIPWVLIKSLNTHLV